MKKESTWSAIGKPIAVLAAICIVVAALLGLTHEATAPIIAENARIEAEAARAAVLEGAQGFEEIDCDCAALGITGAWREVSGLGYVVTASARGYKGDVAVTVGFDGEGRIVGLRADVSTETSGIGSKAGDAAYLDRFLGLADSCGEVDTITNATYSSAAVRQAVGAAMAAVNAIR